MGLSWTTFDPILKFPLRYKNRFFTKHLAMIIFTKFELLIICFIDYGTPKDVGVDYGIYTSFQIFTLFRISVFSQR